MLGRWGSPWWRRTCRKGSACWRRAISAASRKIDLITADERYIIFTEVKLRRGRPFRSGPGVRGRPETGATAHRS